jgi:hypothetical protein
MYPHHEGIKKIEFSNIYYLRITQVDSLISESFSSTKDDYYQMKI